jgi:hypothetical protein
MIRKHYLTDLPKIEYEEDHQRSMEAGSNAFLPITEIIYRTQMKQQKPLDKSC